MIKIGLISDTHGFLDPKILNWFSEVNEIWHAGDIGSMVVLNELEAYKPLRAVYGNIDGHEIRTCLSEDQIFVCGEIKVEAGAPVPPQRSSLIIFISRHRGRLIK